MAKLFEELEDTTEDSEKTCEELIEEIGSELTLHAELEEATLYPITEELKKTHKLTLESEQEHHVIKVLLIELEVLDCNTEEWAAKAKVLEENVNHHVEEEEKADGLFERTEKALGKEGVEKLRQQMEAYLG